MSLSPSSESLACKSLFGIWVAGVALPIPRQVLRPEAAVPAASSASRVLLVGVRRTSVTVLLGGSWIEIEGTTQIRFRRGTGIFPHL
jgi:hypothetical protein